ncbi:thioredoxin-dependent thiol peroxidase [Fluviicola sp.]|jgi:peroxiredoxin Q/BCP|uniref:thioredoxin-dependent thiol peroxidase n=1 Tax=Fluviicola sp. TaxID=1917219 RepID=UPI00281CCA2E|nr:thioredoxin-dependent thiol peroxidase [Fluviicola sp.]MDR0801606.1 thioredoxin-dependent thiol peroxidase [Fluviicola sp.]
MTELKTGDQMPDFWGIDQNGKEWTNQSFKGKKLVIYFYPKDNTPACTNQACSLRDSYQELKEKGYSILGVSMDTEKMHTRFSEKFSLPFPLIADTKRKMIDAFRVWGLKKFMGREYDGIHRTTFIVNEKGIITHIIEKPKTKIHGEEILDLIETS